MAANPVLHAKTKHGNLDLHEKIGSALLQVNYVPAHFQVADVLTKPVSVESFVSLREKLRVFTANPVLNQRKEEAGRELYSLFFFFCFINSELCFFQAS